MIKTLMLMMRLLRMQEQNRLTALKRARGELDRVQGVVTQLDGFAGEYRSRMVREAQAGSTPAELMATLDFERRLAQTAHGQKLVVGQLEGNVERVKMQALQAHMRLDGLKKILAKKKAEVVTQRLRAEAREVEESIAVRQMINGTNDASDRGS